MKYLLAMLISLPAYSNIFEFDHGSSRFLMIITPSMFVYKSETLSQDFHIKKCNEHLTKRLNSELISKVPEVNAKDGLVFKVDGKPYVIDPKSDFAKSLLAMDTKILGFMIEENKTCK